MNKTPETAPAWAIKLWQWVQEHDVPEQRVPKDITQLLALESLTLSNLRLENIPPEIGHLTELKYLSLCGNLLTTLPKEITALQKLTVFDLSNNRFKQLPTFIGKLNTLRHLDASHNDTLEKLPTEITQLSHLETLIMEDCNLNTLPIGFAELQNLRFLALSNNPIQQLPQEITQLKHLFFFLFYDTSYNFDYFHYPLMELCPDLAICVLSSSQEIADDRSYLNDKAQTNLLDNFSDFNDMGILCTYCMIDEQRFKRIAPQKPWSQATNNTIYCFLKFLRENKGQFDWFFGDYDHLSPLFI